MSAAPFQAASAEAKAPSNQRGHSAEPAIVDRLIQNAKLHQVSYPAPTTPKGYAHYVALKAAPDYLKIDELEDGFIYLIHGRNCFIGVWEASSETFIIIREKAGRTSLGRELHWDTSTTNGTGKPFVRLSGPVANDQLRQALEAAHAEITHEKFMELTTSFIRASER